MGEKKPPPPFRPPSMIKTPPPPVFLENTYFDLRDKTGGGVSLEGGNTPGAGTELFLKVPMPKNLSPGAFKKKIL